MLSRDGRYEMDVERRITAGNRVNGTLIALMRRRNVSTAAQMAVHNAVFAAKREYFKRRMKER